MLKEINRYQVRNHIGKGSMADVYEVYDPKTDRLLAIKILREDRREDSEYLQRFFREAKAVGALSHTNIVSIYDIDEFQKRPFIVMEHLKGIPLSELIKSGRRFSFNEIIAIGLQLAMALDYAHSRGIVHRDIKPSNIIIISSNFRVKITDFGIAHFEDPEITMKTRMGDVLGTPQYMSPEQIQGQIVDGRADLFSVGVILYQLLTGERPFSGDTIPTLMYHITTMQPKPLSLGPDVPRAMRYIVKKLLGKKPEDRYQNGKELAAALRQAQSKKNKEPKKLKNVNGNEQNPKPKKSWGKATGIAATVAILAFGSFFAFKNFLAKPPEPGRIYGMVLSGALKNAQVNVYSLNDVAGSGNPNEVKELYITQTNDKGVFVVPLQVPSQPLLLMVRSPDKADNKYLSSVVHYKQGKETGANITVFSHIASALATYAVSQGMSPVEAVNDANAALSEFLQVENLLVVKAGAINAKSGTNPSDDDKFSIIHKALVTLLNRMSQATTDRNNLFTFADLAYTDVVFDGKLNGFGRNGALHFGVRALPLNHLREELADTITQLGKSYDNDYVTNDFYKIALLVNGSTANIFDTANRALAQSSSVHLVSKQLDRIEAIRKKFSGSANAGTAAQPATQSTKNKAPQRVAKTEPVEEPDGKPLADKRQTDGQSSAGRQTAPDDGNAPDEPIATTLLGSVNISGPLKNATVRVVNLTGKSSKSNILATTKTDENGSYTLSLDREPKATVLIAAYGGSYREMISNETVTLDPDQLAVSAVLNIQPRTRQAVNLTFFTHVAAALAQHMIKKGTAPAKAQRIAHQRIKDIVGFEFVKVVPATRFTADSHNGLITPELAYGMFNAAVSNLTLDLSHTQGISAHTKYTSAGYADTAYRDIYYDGLLNGIGATGGISFGPKPVGAQFYRRVLAQSLLAVAQSNINKTGLKFDQFFTIASNYNESTDGIFANERVTTISSEGPLITKLNPAKETTVSGDVKVSATVTDVTGVQRATFWLDSTYLGDAKNPLSPVVSFNSRRFPSGSHRLKINVLNKEGKESTLTHYVYLHNKGPRNTAARRAASR
jgi:serine/threonine protein kinase